MGIREELCVRIAYVLQHSVADGWVKVSDFSTLPQLLEELAQLDAESDAARDLRAACALDRSRV